MPAASRGLRYHRRRHLTQPRRAQHTPTPTPTPTPPDSDAHDSFSFGWFYCSDFRSEHVAAACNVRDDRHAIHSGQAGCAQAGNIAFKIVGTAKRIPCRERRSAEPGLDRQRLTAVAWASLMRPPTTNRPPACAAQPQKRGLARRALRSRDNRRSRSDRRQTRQCLRP